MTKSWLVLFPGLTCRVAPWRMIDSRTLTPAPIVTPVPMETLGPNWFNTENRKQPHYISFHPNNHNMIFPNLLKEHFTYHSSGVNVGRRVNVDITYTQKEQVWTLSSNIRQQKRQKNGDIYHIFWGLAPYLWPVFQGEMCDTGWGTNDWHKLQTWGKKRHVANQRKQMLGVVLREGQSSE